MHGSKRSQKTWWRAIARIELDSLRFAVPRQGRRDAWPSMRHSSTLATERPVRPLQLVKLRFFAGLTPSRRRHEMLGHIALKR